VAAKPVLLKVHNYIAPGDWFHVGGRVYGPDVVMPVHTHDFTELFWIPHGRGWHVINGERKRIEKGDLVLMRPSDAHSYIVRRGETMTLVNIAFAATTWQDLLSRYFSGGDSPWVGGKLPARYVIADAQLAALEQRVNELAAASQTRLEIESFILEVLRIVERSHQSSPADSPMPQWLLEALEAFNDPEHMAEGVQALAQLAGKSPEHVGRVVGKCTGMTATQLINRIRLDHAARQLRLTGMPIIAVADECGLPNLGHFYKVFRKQFGVTPRKYRLHQQSIIR